MEPVDRRLLLAGLGLAGGSLLTRIAQGGDLDPPAGPIAPTMKRLDQVEPRVAVQSLAGTESVAHVIDQPGSYYLTADLMGQPGMAGIEIASDDVSIDLCGFSLIGGLYSGSGIFSSGPYARLHIGNGRVVGWRSHGVDLSQCEQCIMERLNISQVAHTGIIIGAHSMILRCVACECSDLGLQAGAGGRISDCVSQSCAVGIRAGAGCVVEQCVAEGATSVGFDLMNGGGGQQMSRCAARQCGTGVVCNVNTRVQGLSAINCTTAGFAVQGAANVVSECQAIGNPIGYNVTGTGNLIIRNTASANTQQFTIAAGNANGPVVNVVGAIDMSGRANANHPWANFIY